MATDTQDNFPSPLSDVIEESAGSRFTPAWYRWFWQQWLGNVPLRCAPLNAPPAPAKGFVVFCDVSDGKLKALSSAGHVTVLALP